MEAICADLRAECDDLISMLRSLSETQWDLPTPATGWSIRDQVSHLTFFDHTGTLAAADPEAFAQSAKELMSSGVGTNAGLAEGRQKDTDEVLANFIAARFHMIEVFAVLDPKARLPWYGPAMGALSFATARLMETWAHGQDIADTLSIVRTPTIRLKHVAHIGVRARPFSYAIHGKPLPEDEVAVTLRGPDGELWEWNTQLEQQNNVSGSALDFCLVVTQRRHVSDTDLMVTGELASDWIGIAQAFAGDPGTGRAPGQFANNYVVTD